MTSAGDDETVADRAAREATAWFVRLNNPLASDQDRRAFRDWLAVDPSHDEAYAEVRALWAELDAPARMLAAEGRRRAPDRHASPPVRRGATSRGLRLGLAFALIAMIGCGLTLWRDPGLMARLAADHATKPGERREFTLSDGTKLLLDGDTAVTQSFAKASREITVTRGRVFLTVARDGRPFLVHANDLDVTVLGTGFSVDQTEDRVTVDHGLVSVATHGGEGVELKAGDQVQAVDGRLGAPAHIDVDAAFAWRRGLIVLDAAPLSDVFEELGRMAPGRVATLQQEVRAMRLSGVFRADDPDALIEAMRTGLGLKTVSAPGFATLVYR